MAGLALPLRMGRNVIAAATALVLAIWVGGGVAEAVRPRARAPAFKANAVLPDQSFNQLQLEDYVGKWVVLFFYPFDFTFGACRARVARARVPMRRAALSQPLREVPLTDRHRSVPHGTGGLLGQRPRVPVDEHRGAYGGTRAHVHHPTRPRPPPTAVTDRAPSAQVLAVSTDSVHTHLAWIRTKRSDGGVGSLNIPLVADVSKDISRSYGVLVEDQDDAMYGAALRGLFIIDPTGVVRSVQVRRGERQWAVRARAPAPLDACVTPPAARPDQRRQCRAQREGDHSLGEGLPVCRLARGGGLPRQLGARVGHDQDQPRDQDRVLQARVRERVGRENGPARYRALPTPTPPRLPSPGTCIRAW